MSEATRVQEAPSQSAVVEEGVVAVRKLPRDLECPFDNVYLDISEKAMPFLHRTGHTPNLITTYALICTIVSLVKLKEGSYAWWAFLFNLGYVFDCMDGYYARTFKMGSRFGDVYEHVRDVGGGIATFVTVWALYRPAPWWLYVTFGGLAFGSMQHIGCQQKYIQEKRAEELEQQGREPRPVEKLKEQKETLDNFVCLCPKRVPARRSLKWTRWLGAGTITVASTIMVGFLHYRKHKRLM